MKKYIIDTDIGDDIDDAFALDLALKKDLGLLGVTTVFRDTQSRARIVKKLLRLYGKQLPVYAGYGATLDGREDKGRLCQWTPDLDNPEYRPDNSSPEAAVDAILDAARRYGKEFYLLAIGPLTNVARAILKDRETMLKCGGLIMMGGDFVNHYVEWNIHCDVAAAEIVFSSGMEIVAFGHEVTSRARLTSVQQEYVFSMAQDEYHAYRAFPALAPFQADRFSDGSSRRAGGTVCGGAGVLPPALCTRRAGTLREIYVRNDGESVRHGPSQRFRNVYRAICRGSGYCGVYRIFYE